MRTISLFIAVAIALAISACGDSSRFKTAVEYNDFIIEQQAKIIDKMNQYSAAIDAENYADATTKREELVAQCKTSIDSVKAIEAYNGNTAFRDEAANLFTFYKDISEKEYKEMLEILKRDNINEADVQRIHSIRDNIAKREDERDAAFGTAQKKFATDNNLSLM